GTRCLFLRVRLIRWRAKEEGAMPQYRVVFFNNLPSSNGLIFKCTQRSVTVTKARDAEAASEKAKRVFERLENVPNWKCHAHFFEVEEIARIRPRGSGTHSSSSAIHR